MKYRNRTQDCSLEIEYAFSQLLDATGRRVEAWDGGFFRNGDAQSFGRLLETAAAHLEERVSRLNLRSCEWGQARAERQLQSSIRGLKAISQALREEPAQAAAGDHQWLVIGELVLAIAGLLEWIENPDHFPSGSPQSRRRNNGRG
jgi:hypothetical protein